MAILSMRAPTLLGRSVLRAPLTNTTSQRTLTTTPRLLLKEDADRSPEQAEAAKQSQLEEQKRGQGRWREDLASAGESSVKADQDASKVGDHKQHMQELQRAGKEKGEKGEL